MDPFPLSAPSSDLSDSPRGSRSSGGTPYLQSTELGGATEGEELDSAVAILRAYQWLTDPDLAALPSEALRLELLRRLRDTVRGDAVLVHLLTEDRSSLTCEISLGVEGSMPLRAIYGEPPVGSIAASGQPETTRDLHHAGPLSPPYLAEGFCSHLGVPLVLDGGVIGVLSVLTRARRRFEDLDGRALALVADRLAPNLDRARLLERSRIEGEHSEALSRRLVAIQEEERREIALELHDEIGQLLTSLRLALKPGSGSVTSVDEIVTELFSRVRNMSLRLRPPMLDDVGLASSISWHCERFSAQTGIRVRLEMSGLKRLPPQLELAVFRIIQEALTNVARHAHVPEAHVAVRFVGSTLEVHVIDLGRGFDAMHLGSSGGLTGMSERAKLVNGRLSIQSEPGGGTRVQLRVPLHAVPVSFP